MAKGYWIVRADVHNPEAYKAYIAANEVAFCKYGARRLVRSGRFETMEGGSRARNVVVEFRDYETALACYRSDEYQQALVLRLPHAEADLIIIEGYGDPSS